MVKIRIKIPDLGNKHKYSDYCIYKNKFPLGHSRNYLVNSILYALNYVNGFTFFGMFW